MARTRTDAARPILPSVLDRLLDAEPGVQREPASSRAQTLRDLRQSVRRDLENLLNTRVRPVALPESATELDQSLVNYGLPDLMDADLVTAEGRTSVCRKVEAVVRKFEPRFRSVRVDLLDNTELLDRTLRFRIEALLHAEPAPEHVAFDSVLEPATGSFIVKGASDA